MPEIAGTLRAEAVEETWRVGLTWFRAVKSKPAEFGWPTKGHDGRNLAPGQRARDRSRQRRRRSASRILAAGQC